MRLEPVYTASYTFTRGQSKAVQVRDWHFCTIPLEPCVGSCFTPNLLIAISGPEGLADTIWQWKPKKNPLSIPGVNGYRDTDIEATM